MLNTPIQKYEWIDSLRGYAIFLVIMIHNTRGLNMSSTLHRITVLGDLGVQLFFILSSFTLFNSYSKRRLVDFKNTNLFFFIRRFFRIAPLYYIAILAYVAISYYTPGLFVKNQINFFYVIISVLFLNTFFLPAINYLPPGGWSIGIEMIFYLLIPWFYKQATSAKKVFYLLIITILISNTCNYISFYFITHFTTIDWVKLRGYHLYFWLPNQLPVFVFGILVYKIKDKITISKKITNFILWLSILVFMMFAFYNFKIEYPYYFIQREYFYSFLFSIIVLAVAKTNNRLIVNPFFINLGKVSFSIYLIHFMVIEMVRHLFNYFHLTLYSDDFRYLFSLSLSIIISYICAKLTYKYVEIKGIAFGENIISRIRNRSEIQ